MSITEIKQAMGGWTLRLREDTPQQVRDALTFYGHIAILPGELPVAQYGDTLLSSARYVGVLRGYDATDDRTLKGSGMAFWLGDEDGKGDVFEAAVTLTAQSFANSVRALLPPGGAVAEGTLFSVSGTYDGKHQWVTPREAITYVTDTFGAEWRVNNDATLDAGTVAQLYVTTPKALLLRKGFGSDLSRRALAGRMAMGVDVEDVTTRVVLLAEGEGSSIATGEANVLSNPYKDLRGNPIKATRLVSESGTSATNAHSRAILSLNRFITARRSVQLSTSEYDVKNTFRVGDYIDVYDPENGFYDANREVYWQGERLNPMALRCVETTWPIPPGWTVGFRDINGVWTDLSPYYVGESGDTTIVVGELARGLASVGGEPVGVRPNLPDATLPPPDTTIPGVVAWTGFSSGSYESEDRTHSAIQAQWALPLNGDGSTIQDGDHYEIQLRPNAIVGAPTPWDYLSGGYDVDYETSFDTAVTGGFGTGWANHSSSTELSVASGEAQVAHPTVGILRGAYYTGAGNLADVEVLSSNKVNYVISGASTVLGTTFRRLDANNYYWCRVEPNADQTVTAKITKYKAGVFSELAVLKIPGMVHTPGVEYFNKVSGVGSVITMKVWQGPGEEPERDTLNAWDSDPIVGAGAFGFLDYIVGGSGNTGGVTRHPSFRVRSLAPDNTANAYSWDDLGTWDAMTSEPVAVTDIWSTSYVPFDLLSYTLTDLGPGLQYEIRIRAVDVNGNYGPWSVVQFINTSSDAISPSTPAPPQVASSMIAIQVTHFLGKASGGTFNLEIDLDHLDVHVGGDPGFSPEDTSKVGELIATGGMARSGIPAIGTFKVDNVLDFWVKVVAVDRAGNKSGPSEAVQSSATLIDDAHITNLSVSKLTAGTITADTVLAAEMEVGAGGNIKLTDGSLDVFDNAGIKQVEIGKLSDDSYGLAAVSAAGTLTKLNDLIFGPQTDFVLATITANDTGLYSGPSVTVTVGETGRLIIILSAQMEYESINQPVGVSSAGGGRMGFGMTGANSMGPDAFKSLVFTDSLGLGGDVSNTHTITATRRGSYVHFLEGLNPGATFVQAHYSAAYSGKTVDFRDRTLIVLPY